MNKNLNKRIYPIAEADGINPKITRKNKKTARLSQVGRFVLLTFKTPKKSTLQIY